MSATISTLAGVAGGSVATYWLQRANDRRREGRETRSVEAADQRASTRAARLVLTELFTVIGHMQSSYQIKGWMRDLRLPDHAWLQERGHLSTALTDGQWRDIATAFMNVAVWNDLMRTWRQGDPLARWKPKANLPDSDSEGMSTMRLMLIQTCGQAAEAIRPLALPSLADDDPLATFFQRAKKADEQVAPTQ
jgi:hypothetical protein